MTSATPPDAAPATDAGVVDAYAHVGFPRFLPVADYRTLMTEHGIGRAVLSAFDSSPDLAAFSSALAAEPERFRALGIPLGHDDDELRAGIDAQLAAGFSGIRLTETDVRDRPWLLKRILDQGGVLLPTGRISDSAIAATLLGLLERDDGAQVVAAHFAGGGAPAALTGAAAELFGHPRFNVVFSRHGGFGSDAIVGWAEAVLTLTGWDRVLWGSEAPVLFWRDETLTTALSWVDRLAPNESERAAFLGGNAARIYFSRPVSGAGTPELPFAPADRAHIIPARLWMWGLDVDQRLAGRLVAAWVKAGRPGTLGRFAAEQLAQTLPEGPADEDAPTSTPPD